MDFVIGHPRSGTELLSQLLNTGGLEHARHEVLPRLSLRGVCVPTQYYAGSVGIERVLRLIDRYAEQPDVSIDCSWKSTWILPALMLRYPEARVLHLTRDPRENVRACFNLDYYGDSWRRVPLGEGNERHLRRRQHFWLRWMPRIRRPDWDSLSQLERNCAFWSETHRLALEAADRPGRYLRLRLEDLFLPHTLASLFSFFSLPLPLPARIEEVRLTRYNAKEQEKQEIAAVKTDLLVPPLQWNEETQRALARQCGEMAQALGYDARPLR